MDCHSQSWVRCIYQDWQGFMWFGTGDGLNKYDGYLITTYYANSEQGLTGNTINSIYEDNNKNLWIVTNKGINLFDRENDSFIHKPNWPQKGINDIFELTDNKFMLATNGNGLLIFNPDSGLIKSYVPNTDDPINYSSYNDPFSLSTYVVKCILKDRRENIWIGGTRGISLFNLVTKKFLNFRKDNNITS